MIVAETVLKALLTLRDEHAEAALGTPQDKTEFGYGMAAGIYRGLSLAVEKVERSIEEDAQQALDQELNDAD